VTASQRAVERRFTSEAGPELLELVREIAAKELTPRVDEYESQARFPREVYATLGDAGLLGLSYPADLGGAGLPARDYLQLLEEIAGAWLSLGIGVSVQTLATFPLAAYGTPSQQAELATRLTSGELLGAYCLSEPHCGSDAAALTTRAVLDGDSYVVDGTKAWTTHGGVADVYNLMVRTSDDGPRGITCLLADAETEGLAPREPEHKMAAGASPTAQVVLTAAAVPASRRIGEEGQGFAIAMAALDAGRLGIAACAVGLAQSALDLAVHYAREREAFGRPIGAFQGVSFMLADMATSVAAARALYLEAADRKDAGVPFSAQAAMAKLFATDAAMRVTTDTVQVLGGAGYVADWPAERWFREAKVLQIVEGTNQIQRVVIGRHLTGL
jgi:alkylation response protein AidB-like acyl-CoA dehydrogenase